MKHLTNQQFESLSGDIYKSFMGLTIPCSCGESGTLGMGEMGEARNAAELIIKEWCEKEGIEILDEMDESEKDTSDDIPLWRKLNSERTQGEWIGNDGLKIKKVYLNDKGSVKDGYKLIFAPSANYGIPLKEQDTNAQYTALAVNNLAELAGALEGIYKYCIRNTGNFPPELLRAKEALSKIS